MFTLIDKSKMAIPQKLYSIGRDSTRQPLEGWESAIVPAGLCPDCGREVRQTIDYPLLNAEHIASSGKRRPAPVPLAELKRQEREAQRTGALRGLLLPLSNLGPWKFKRKSNEPWRDVDVLFPDPGGMLWKPELLEKCRCAGFEIFAAELSIPSEKGRSVQRFHVDIPAFDFLHQKTFAERGMVLCTTCGEFESDAFSPDVETFWLDQSRMRVIPPLFVPRTFENSVFLSPEFGRFLVELQPSGAKFEEIGLII